MDEFDIMPAIVRPSLNCRTLWIHYEHELDASARRHYHPLGDDRLAAHHADIAVVLSLLYQRLRKPSSADAALDAWRPIDEPPRDHAWYERRIGDVMRLKRRQPKLSVEKYTSLRDCLHTRLDE